MQELRRTQARSSDSTSFSPEMPFASRLAFAFGLPAPPPCKKGSMRAMPIPRFTSIKAAENALRTTESTLRLAGRDASTPVTDVMIAAATFVS